MEPVEINAGRCYLRAFRADDRLDDRPALIEAFADDAMHQYVRPYRVQSTEQATAYIAARARGWEVEDRASWAIAEPTTGALIGEVGLKNLSRNDGAAEAAIWVHPAARRRRIAEAALPAAARFGFGMFELTRVDYVCDDDNKASAALAARCGFEHVGPTRSADGVPSQRWTLRA